ncbi:MAG TPA: hypothetical protein VMR25_01185, partial [Planctomycetaceae bacterium]|nr:hypothetical protein [Planctomycetaceae bacterium]
EPVPVPPGTPVTTTVTQATSPSPPASIILGARHGHVTPNRCGFTHTGGGNIDVAQPTADVVVVTMTGVAVAGAHPCKDSLAAMRFDLAQSFEISFDSPKLTRAKLVLEGRVIGLLRSHAKGGGSAGEGPGCATILSNDVSLITLCVPEHSVTCGENLSINDHDGPAEVPISAGKYTLVQSFVVSAAHPMSLRPCKAASAEFAPDPALDPLWISYWEPFHGAVKKDFGFQITIRVVEDTSSARK